MKLSTFLLFVTVFNLFGSITYSQNARLNLDMKDATIQTVLKAIEGQSEFFFLYSSKMIDVNKKVDINVSDRKITEVLDELITGTDIKYAVRDKQILLFNKEADMTMILQQNRITGTVTDKNGSPLTGVNVVVTGTTQGTMTDIDGKYSIEVPQGSKSLKFSFIGMQPQEISIGTLTQINLVMVESPIGLEEVVVIGYGTVKKSDLTGSISTIKSDAINLQAIGNPVQALATIAPGIQILENSGQPGADLNVLIRGGNSLLGSNNPLYVVDGFPIVGDLSSISVNDIQSIEILKDASATAIYGSRGANGIIMVTTKKGNDGKTSIEYNGYYGFQKVNKIIDMLNAKEFATLANVRALNDNLPLYFSEAEIASFDEGTDWQNEIFQIAPIQNHSLSISGGNGKTKFYVSGSYFDQDGIIINSGYKHLQFRTNLEQKIGPNWKIVTTITTDRRNQNNLWSNNTERGEGVLSGALVAAPTMSPRDDEGKYNNIMYAFTPPIAENPVAMANERKMLTGNKSLLLNLFTEGNLTKNLVLYSSIGINYQNSRDDYYSPSIFKSSATGSASISLSEYSDIVNENLLTYSKKVSDYHDLKVMAGLTSEMQTSQYISASSSGFLSDKLENYSLQSGNAYGTPTSGYIKYSLLSYLGRINYTFMGKYLITSSIRADGSSRMGKTNKWGYFPSAAVAWKVSDEDFLKGNKTLSNLKLRSSWGQTGNTAVSPYQSLSILTSTQTVFDNSIAIGYAPSNIMPNPNLKWESTSQIDAGTDIGLFDDRMFVTFDYYYKKTKDLLASIPVVLSSGYSTQSTNLGSIENKGFEISIESNIVKGLFSWSIGANIAVNRNKVLNLAGGTDIFGESLGSALPSMSLVREGYPIGVFYGFVEDGINEDGSIKYSDYDDNGVINSLDRRIIGDPNPDFIFGINSNISYKNFKVEILIGGVQGNDILNYNKSNIASGMYFGENQIKDLLGNYWTKENPNPNAKYPLISIHTQYLGSDRYIEDGSYIRIKNIKFSYALKGDKFKSSPFYNSEVFLNFQNLLTFTNYSFYSPAINTHGGGISKGIDQWGYPDAKTITVGVRINWNKE